MYDDAYATCARTYATLCIYPGDVDPAAITERLGVEPTTWQRRGEVARRTDGPPRAATIDGWFLESRGQVDSRDSRRHIDWLLDRMEPKAEAVRSLQEMGCRMVVSCYWLSRYGQGGPTLSAIQMKRLGELGIELWFDIYRPAEESPDEPGPAVAP
jgi:hypothetical protein